MSRAVLSPVSWLIFRADLKNFRDPKGFRARLFRVGMPRQIFFIVLMVAGIFAIVPLILKSQGSQWFYRVLAACSLGMTAMFSRGLAINRSRFYVTTAFSGSIIGVGALLVGLNLLPPLTINFFILAQVALTLRTASERPLRMDYNLFLRAAEGMLTPPTAGISRGGTARLDKPDLLAFGRFLGTRWLAIDSRWVADEFKLRLSPVKWWLWGAMPLLSSWAGRSCVMLGWDGMVRAELGDKDEPMLRKLRNGEVLGKTELEEQVTAAIESAWWNFRANDFAAAERALGQSSDESVFVKSPSRRTA